MGRGTITYTLSLYGIKNEIIASCDHIDCDHRMYFLFRDKIVKLLYDDLVRVKI